MYMYCALGVRRRRACNALRASAAAALGARPSARLAFVRRPNGRHIGYVPVQYARYVPII